MGEHRLQFKAEISKKRAIDKIAVHAMYGKHRNSGGFSSIRDVQQYYVRKGYNTDTLVRNCRNPTNPVPEFENLVRSTWFTSGNAKLINRSTGRIVSEVDGPGRLMWPTYEAHFEAACSARDRAISEGSYTAFLECLTQGFASIEAFFNTEAQRWNDSHPGDRLEDNGNLKISLETKVTEWTPRMSGGETVDKSVQQWSDFKLLQRIRHECAAHPKLSGDGVSYKQLADYINAFRFGIALLLGNIHLKIVRPIPAVIINAHYAPDVIVVNTQE